MIFYYKTFMNYNKNLSYNIFNDKLVMNNNLQKIIYTHLFLEKTKPNYLKPTISSINKRSYLYKEKNTLFDLSILYDECLKLEKQLKALNSFNLIPKSRYNFI
jgi:hypothetical protein